MTVKIIPITPEYREGWESVDWNKGKINKKQCMQCGRDILSFVTPDNLCYRCSVIRRTF